MLRPDGHPVKAEREPVLDMETWETLKAVLALPKREISAGRIDRQYMLVGFLRCKGGAKSSQVTSTIAGVECVVGTPQVGTGIGAAATAFCVSLAARCTGISASAADQGEAISVAAQLYMAADDHAASGFNYMASLAI